MFLPLLKTINSNNKMFIWLYKTRKKMGQNIFLYNLRCVASLEIIVASLAVGEN